MVCDWALVLGVCWVCAVCVLSRLWVGVRVRVLCSCVVFVCPCVVFVCCVMCVVFVCCVFVCLCVVCMLYVGMGGC